MIPVPNQPRTYFANTKARLPVGYSHAETINTSGFVDNDGGPRAVPLFQTRIRTKLIPNLKRTTGNLPTLKSSSRRRARKALHRG